MYSIIIPVYRNEATLPAVVERLEALSEEFGGALEAVFVVDGSPDCSYLALKELLPKASFVSQLVVLSRNFGSAAAGRKGIAVACGPQFCTMAADLQEPAELISQFFRALDSGEFDVAIGVRTRRADPLLTRVTSRLFWAFYRRWIQREVPAGGFDMFACNLPVRNALVSLPESNSSHVGLLLWLGFRRIEIPYERLRRLDGKSAWTIGRRVRYMLDSIFSFTELPITALLIIGVIGIIASIFISLIILIMRFAGDISVPGYTPIILALLFSFNVNLFGLGIVGSYVWRTFDNSKQRPPYVTLSHEHFGEYVGQEQ